MKIKSIDTFSLAECQEYLSMNPNGEDAKKVVDRMEHLREFEERKLQNAARKTDEFNTEFNRYYGIQRYPEAFAICLRYLNEVDDKTKVIEKANIVIPKLSNRIQIPPEVPSISYDWLIDQLVLKGYGKMKYDGSSLKWKMSVVQIFSNGKATEIVSKCRVNLFFRIVLTIFFFAAIITFICASLDGSWNFWPYLISVIVAILFSAIWIYVFTMIILNHPKCLLREIANISIEYLSK